MNTAISLILILGIFVYTILKKRDFLSPATTFSIVMLFAFFLHSLQLSKMQTDYGVESLLVVLSALASFWIGSKLSKVVKSKRKKPKYGLNKRRFKIMFYLLFLAVVGSYFVTWAILGAPPLLSKVDRATYFVSGIGTIYLLIDSLSFMAIYDWFGDKILGKKSLLVLLVIILMMITVSNKFQIFALLCQGLILYNVEKKKVKLKYIALLLLLVLLIFVAFYSYIYDGMYISSDALYLETGMKLPSNLSFLTEPYLYVAYNFDNLFNYMFNASNIVFGHGYFVTHGLMESANLTSFMVPDHQTLDILWSNNLGHWWLTTGTFFREFYQDFGMFGILFGTGIIGFICGKAYNSVKKNINIFNTYLYTICMVSILFAFFTNNFIAVKTLVNIACMYFVYWVCRERKDENDSKDS